MTVSRRWRWTFALVLLAVLGPAIWWSAQAAPERAPVECRIEATVLRHEDGAPIEGARIVLEDRGCGALREIVTAADGRAEFTCLVAENFLQVAAHAEGRAVAAESLMVFVGCGRSPLTRREHRFEFRLPLSGTVRGRVLLPDGTAMEGAQVGMIDRGRDGPWVRWPEATSGADGSFRLEGVPLDRDVEIECGPLGPSKRHIRCFEPPAWAPASSPLRLRLNAERPEESVEIRLRAVGTLSLRVSGPAGERVSAGDIDLRALEHQIAPRLSFADGSFRRTFEPGRYRLVVRAAGYRDSAPRDVDVPAGGTAEIDVQLAR